MTSIRNTFAARLPGRHRAGRFRRLCPDRASAHGRSAAATAQPRTFLTVRQVYDTLTSAGYRNITEIELEHGRYDVKADNPQGQRVKLRVDAQNGAVLRSRLKD